MNEEKKQKKLFYIIIGIALTLVLGIGISFAVFTAQANRNANLVTTGTLQIRYTEGSTITADNLKPATVEQVKEAYTHGSCIYAGDRTAGMTTEKICAYKTFTITNIGSLTAYTNVTLEDITNTYQNLKYQLFETIPATLSGINLLNTTELVNDIELLPNGNKTYTLLIWLDESATIETDQNKSYTAKITASAITTTNKNLDTSGANAPVLADGMIPIAYKQCGEIDSYKKYLSCYRESINDTDRSGFQTFCNSMEGSTPEYCEYIIDELITNGTIGEGEDILTLDDFISVYEEAGYTMTSNFESCDEKATLLYELYPQCHGDETYVNNINNTDRAGFQTFCVNDAGETAEDCEYIIDELITNGFMGEGEDILTLDMFISMYESAGYTMTSTPGYVFLEENLYSYKADSNNIDLPYQWYDYNNKKWANAIMIKSISETNTTLSDGTACTGTNGYCTREDYMNAKDGVEVPEADILAYYVWIPRYKYQLFNVEFAETSEQLINVEFERGIASTGNVRCNTSEIGVETCSNKANGNWYTHPAFTFGEDELEGIWVGKFETGYGTNTTGDPGNIVYSTPIIKPNVMPLLNQQVSKRFQTAQYFGTGAYLTNKGVNEVDSHMMKNSEWGAVAYLKQSTYGLGTTDIAPNTYGDLTSEHLLTGCGPQSAGSEDYGSTCNAYHTTLGMSASTTGNITGVYDMSGGAGEYTMGVIQDNTTTGRSPMSGNSASYNSGYVGKVGEDYADSGNTLAFPAAKYYDLYANGIETWDQTAYNRSHLGDAAGETRSWYNDTAAFPYVFDPWFIRGSYWVTGAETGVFSFRASDGSENIIGNGFRSALAVNK